MAKPVCALQDKSGDFLFFLSINPTKYQINTTTIKKNCSLCYKLPGRTWCHHLLPQSYIHHPATRTKLALSYCSLYSSLCDALHFFAPVASNYAAFKNMKLYISDPFFFKIYIFSNNKWAWGQIEWKIQ